MDKHTKLLNLFPLSELVITEKRSKHETSLTKHLRFRRAIDSQQSFSMRWPFKWSHRPETWCRTSRTRRWHPSVVNFLPWICPTLTLTPSPPFSEQSLPKIRPLVSDLPLDRVIKCLRTARKHKSDLLDARFALAVSLVYRYCVTFVNDDYDEAASVLGEIIALIPPEGIQDELIARVKEMEIEPVMIRSVIRWCMVPRNIALAPFSVHLLKKTL